MGLFQRVTINPQAPADLVVGDQQVARSQSITNEKGSAGVLLSESLGDATHVMIQVQDAPVAYYFGEAREGDFIAPEYTMLILNRAQAQNVRFTRQTGKAATLVWQPMTLSMDAQQGGGT